MSLLARSLQPTPDNRSGNPHQVEQMSDIDPHQLIGYMPEVESYKDTLQQKITLIGKINSLNIAATLLDDMEHTKRKFEKLQERLIDNLLQESLRKIELEIAARAQVAIDILIRNLFERTADVGFLATDDDVRAFLTGQGEVAGARERIGERLREYTLKYSVYDEIVILDRDGRVCANLNPDNPISQSHDPLIAETLASREEYVETFRASDLQPYRRQALIYSSRIHASDAPGAEVIGVLCLCFRFDNEMEGIFANLVQGGELIAILDHHGSVIASSQPRQLPIGSPTARAEQGVAIVRHNDRPYLVSTRQTKGYQGFTGLGWMGHVMIPLQRAFGQESSNQAADSDRQTESSSLFSEELRSISRNAAMVTDDLILVVLNGQIISAKKDASEFMPVLDEIRSIGNRTKAVFDNSIANLHHTVISSLLSDVRFQAFLAVDIMDRNLYERANDVRWWALTTRFRELLAGDLSSGESGTIASILSYINNLYTVYTNLFVYDRNGRIVAVSNPDERQQLGRSVAGEETVQAALRLQQSQRYTVSPFEPSPLYGGRHTYIYHSSILDLTTRQQVIGGIGIVFDSEPQFEAMLIDSLPRNRNGELIEGAFALFASPDGRVIASSSSKHAAGDMLELDQRLTEVENGQRASAIITLDGQRYAAGSAMSQGYREYKTTGDYSNDILGMVFVPV
jgi:hypothetical protein